MDFDLGTYLPYQARRAGAAVEDAFWESMKIYELTVEEWRVLAVLYSDGSQTLNELARRTAVKLSTLSRLIGRMENRALVSRKRPESNQRSVIISLKTNGRELTEKLIPHCLRYEQEILKQFTKAEEKQLRTLLTRLYAYLEENPYDPAKALQPAE